MIELIDGEIPVIQQKHDYAIVAITKHGVEMARDLLKQFPNADLYYTNKFSKNDEESLGIQLYRGNVRILLPALFPKYKGLILFISLGAVVRMIAPMLKDKYTDPGIVVVDDRGEHVISVLSGHLGGANELTLEVAKLMNAKPVVTTASDVQKTIAVDLFGHRFGWVWDLPDNLTPVSASVVNEEHVAIVQESGELDWWVYDHPLPSHIKLYPTIHQAINAKPDAALIITHRLLEESEEAILKNGIVFRPKVIVLGIGCNRGTSAEEIDEVIDETLHELNCSPKSIKAICTIDLKKDEVGLLEVASKRNVEFCYYTPPELNEMHIEMPSDVVYKYTGAYAVSEAAAKRYLQSDSLLLVKKKSGNVTISVGILQHEGEYPWQKDLSSREQDLALEKQQ